MQTPVYKENWVFDTDPLGQRSPDEYQRFQYRWIYLPTGQTNIRGVLCKDAEVFVSLLERWNANMNSEKWQYMVI